LKKGGRISIASAVVKFARPCNVITPVIRALVDVGLNRVISISIFGHPIPRPPRTGKWSLFRTTLPSDPLVAVCGGGGGACVITNQLLRT